MACLLWYPKFNPFRRTQGSAELGAVGGCVCMSVKETMIRCRPDVLDAIVYNAVRVDMTQRS